MFILIVFVDFDSDYDMSQKVFELETGKAYRLEISSMGFKEYEFEAEDFFRNVWIRNIEVEGIEIDTSASTSQSVWAGSRLATLPFRLPVPVPFRQSLLPGLRLSFLSCVPGTRLPVPGSGRPSFRVSCRPWCAATACASASAGPPRIPRPRPPCAPFWVRPASRGWRRTFSRAGCRCDGSRCLL